MNFGQLTNRVMDATLRGGALAGGNREQVQEDINEAIKTVDLLLRPVIVTTTEVLVSGQSDYSIATDFLVTDITGIRDVSYTSINNGGSRSLRQLGPSELRELRDTTALNATWVDAYAIDGLGTLMLQPATTSIGDTIAITYVERPLTLSLETDTPTGLPEEWHELYELAAIQRSMRQSSPEYAASYTQMYEHKMDEYRKWSNRRAGARGRVATVGPARRVRRFNDQDWR